MNCEQNVHRRFLFRVMYLKHSYAGFFIMLCGVLRQSSEYHGYNFHTVQKLFGRRFKISHTRLLHAFGDRHDVCCCQHCSVTLLTLKSLILQNSMSAGCWMYRFDWHLTLQRCITNWNTYKLINSVLNLSIIRRGPR